MKLQRHLDALKDDLEQLAALADESVAETARRLTSALESSVRVRLLVVLQRVEMSLQLHSDIIMTSYRRLSSVTAQPPWRRPGTGDLPRQ